MIFTPNALFRFLDKLTPQTAKGLMLQLNLDVIAGLSPIEKIAEVKSLLNQAEQEKRCLVLQGADEMRLFIYFPENHQDDIAALLIKIQFNLGLSLTGDLKGKSPFYSLYRVKEDLNKLKALSKTSKSPTRNSSAPAGAKATPLVPVLPEAHFEMPFTPALLAQLEKSLQQADLSNLMRRQAVCALVGHARPVELFEEIYVALADLKKALCPTVDIYQSTWLLDRLLETLDKRVLENMTHHDAGAFRKNFSLNIAVKTILSPDFQVFDESIDPLFKQSILLEIKQHDIFSNLPAFLAARSYIAEQGYRLCIDMVSGDSLPLIDREKLGADFVKLIWSPDLLNTSTTPSFIKAVQSNDPKRIILCRVDDKRAIELGQTLGLSLFQGYYIQKLLYQTPKKNIK